MEEYNRDSLREMRRSEAVAWQEHKEKGSRFLTFLIILLLLGAGGFYLFTARPAWLDQWIGASTEVWNKEIAPVFAPKEQTDVQQTVDAALAEKDG